MKKIDRTTLTIIRCAIPLCLSFLIVFGVIFVAVLRPSLGWFSTADNLTATGMRVISHSENCEILVERATEYDKTKGTYPIEPIERYPGIAALKTYLGADGFDATTATSTANAPKLAFELINELERNDVDDYVGGTVSTRYLMPGAYGTLSFYLRPINGATRVTKTFHLSLKGFYSVESEGNYTISSVSSGTTLDLLKGHVLFFTDRTGGSHEEYRYDGLVEDSFVYDTAEHELCGEVGKEGCYKITLYWEWPETYLDIARNMSTDLQTKKYPSELGDYITSYPWYFFAINQASPDETERSEGYDDGDQKIGNQVHFISVILEMGG